MIGWIRLWMICYIIIEISSIFVNESKVKTRYQQCGLQPANISAKLEMSVASVMSSLTVYSTLKVLSSFRATPFSARSAASSSVPLCMSIPMPSLSVSFTLWFVSGCARRNFTALAVLQRSQSRVTLVQYTSSYHECKGSYLKTSRTVLMTSEPSRNTRIVSSAQRRKTPSVPLMPKPSTMSAVSLKGTRSGMGSNFPYTRHDFNT